MSNQARRNMLVVGAIIIALAAALTLVYAQYEIRSRGRIKAVGVGVYSDLECTQAVRDIDWGIVEPGGNRTVQVYIKNTSNVPVNMTLETLDWIPAAAEGYMTLSWNYDGHELQLLEVVIINLVLQVSPDITGIDDFSFDIIIIGYG